MRIFIFKSQSRDNLRAFAGDMTGTRLPDRFGPWRLIRAIPRGVALPHHLPRPEIESAINAEGFQLWRFKAEAAAATA